MTRLQEYFTELIKAFNECHSNLLINITEDDIHKLRTTLKKIKTFNLILDSLLFREKNFPIELSILFDKIGQIRDIQIQQKLLEKYDENYTNTLINYYNKVLIELNIKNSYQEEIDLLEDKLNKVEEYHIDDQIFLNIKSYIDICYDDIKNIIIDVSPEILHKIRIKIKRIYYNILMINDLKNKDILDKIQDSIGLWHDCDITIEKIKSFDNNQEVIDILILKKEILYNESVKLLKQLF